MRRDKLSIRYRYRVYLLSPLFVSQMEKNQREIENVKNMPPIQSVTEIPLIRTLFIILLSREI